MGAGPAEEVRVAVGKIIEAIQIAEKGTTGEIRVHIARRFFEPDPLLRAKKIFYQLGMQKTQARNGILLYVNVTRKKFAIVGDTGIHEKVSQRYWDQIAKELGEALKSTHYENAIAWAVNKMGKPLRKYFPADGQVNPNELTDEVSED